MIQRRTFLQAMSGLPLLSAAPPLLGASSNSSDYYKPTISLPELTEGKFEQFVRAKYGNQQVEQSSAIKFSVPPLVENPTTTPCTVWIDLDDRDWLCTAMTIYSECTRQEQWPQPPYRFYTYRIMELKFTGAEPYFSFRSRLFNPPATLCVVAILRNLHNDAVRFISNKSPAMPYHGGDGGAYMGLSHSQEESTGP